MNFGKYLIENSVVEKEDFIQTVLKQVNTQPTTLASLIELNIVDMDKVLEIIFTSFDEGLDMISSMKKVGVGEAEIEKVKEFQNQHTLNIIDTLVSDGLADKETVLEMFSNFENRKDDISTDDKSEEAPKEADDGDSIISAAALESLKELQGGELDMSEFEAGPEAEASTKDVATPEVSVAPPAVEEVEISAAALESLKEMGGVPEDELAALEKVTETLASESESVLEPSALDYISIYDEKKNQKINKILKMVKEAAEGDSDIANYFNSLFRELHVVKGAAVLVDAKYSKKLIEIWELIIDKIFTMSNPELKAWFFSYEDALVGTSKILWDIRESIKNGASEDNYMENEAARSSYLSNIGTLKKIITEIS